MKSLLSLLLFLFIFYSAHSQKEGNIWTFGDSAAIDFNNGSPVPLIGTVVVSTECSCTLSDINGNLLFYAGTESINFPGWITLKIWNKYNKVINNGTGIHGNSSSAQGCVLFPNPGDSNLIYLISHRRYDTAPPISQIYYSIIDKSANSDSGAVIIKNIPLPGIDTNMVEQIQLIKHGNGRDWWLLAHKAGTSEFYKYIINPYVIDGPFIQSIGNNFTINSGYGTMKTSPGGNKIVVVGGNGIIDLYDFDRCTGLLSNHISLGDGPVFLDSKYGCSFSSNSLMLYVSDTDTALYQFNLLAPDIKASRQTIWLRPDTADSSIGQHLLGPDAKIYIVNAKPNFAPNSFFNLENMNLSVINNPDSLGLACNFQPYSFYLGGRRSFAGLPNIPDYNLGVIEGSICDSLTVGIDEIAKAVISVYPNPAFDFIYINNITIIENHKIELFDISGRKIISKKLTSNQIDVSNIKEGFYIFRIVKKNAVIKSGKISIMR